jgi:hypothetical protein
MDMGKQAEISYQPSAISHQLSAIGFQQSAFNFPSIEVDPLSVLR